MTQYASFLRPGLFAAAATLAALPVLAEANFTRYVALGDSLTAGVASAGLAIDSQANSYPYLLHLQATGGSPAFQQPTVSNPGIPNQLQLVALVPRVTLAPKPGAGQPTNLTLARPYDNLGVPGARVRDTLATVTGGAHDLVLRRIGTALQQAIALRPTFTSLWIGNNDALAAATSGLVIDGVTLTTLGAFEADYRAIVGALRSTGTQLAMATIPNVTAIPFVTTLPPFIINPATNQPVLINGQLVTYIGPNGPLSPADYVLLSAQTPLGQGFGIPVALGGNGQPLGDQFVLSAAEAATITARVNGYNNIIRTVANESGAALLDVAPIFDEIAAEGYDVGGVTFDESFLTGGMFSYDGVHPSKFGYAVIANELIRVINETFDDHIEEVNLLPFWEGHGLPGGQLLTPDMARSARFTSAGLYTLYEVLGIPSINRLLKLKNGRAGGVIVN